MPQNGARRLDLPANLEPKLFFGLAMVMVPVVYPTNEELPIKLIDTASRARGRAMSGVKLHGDVALRLHQQRSASRQDFIDDDLTDARDIKLTANKNLG